MELWVSGGASVENYMVRRAYHALLRGENMLPGVVWCDLLHALYVTDDVAARLTEPWHTGLHASAVLAEETAEGIVALMMAVAHDFIAVTLFRIVFAAVLFVMILMIFLQHLVAMFECCV